MSIRLKIVCIVLGFFIISGVIFVLYSNATTENYRQLRIAEVSKTIAYESERVGRIILELERNVVEMAMLARQGYMLRRTPEEFRILASQQRYVFEPLRNAAGGGIWFEPFTLDPDTQRVCYYVYYDPVTEAEIYDPNFEGEEYDYHTQSWYTEIAARLTGRRSIARATPYLESIGTVSLLSTVGAGIYDENDRFIGMATVDWRIQDIVDRLIAANPVQNSYILLASISDDYILSFTHPDGADMIGESLSALPQLEDLAISVTVDDINNVHMIHFIYDDVEYYAFSRLLNNEWLFSIQIPRKEIFAEVESRNIRFLIIVVISSLFLLLLTFILLSRLINRPLIKLTSGVAALGGGDLDKHIAIRSKDEIGMLAAAFNKMTVELKASIEQSARECAEKERVNAEFTVAAAIQANMLPHTFPPFPQYQEFDIYASIQGAKEACGDFYDFFLIDNNTLAFVIADVSDKGMPAAMFMVVAKTLIKSNAQQGKSPKEVFESVNNLLYENNVSFMFVTAFLGYLDIPSGKITYVNAGHNPPLIKCSGDNYRMLPVNPGFILAGKENMIYNQYEINLNEGDELFLYTDGITEAVNDERVFFGDEHLIETTNKYHNIPLKEFTQSIKQEIDLFTNGMKQVDVITMLLLRYNGFVNVQLNKLPARELVIDAELQNLSDLLAFVNACLDENGCPKELKNEIKIAVEEIFVNIASYAYKPDKGSVTITIHLWTDGITLEFEDSGAAYNPLEKDDPDVSLSAKERQLGGLGIFMVKNIMDHVEYTYKNGKNILTIKKIIRN